MRVLFGPERPWEWCSTYTALRVAEYLGWEATDDPKQEDVRLAFMWLDETWAQPDAEIAALAGRMPVWNLHCNDISKRRVEEVFVTHFGYSSLLDPRSHVGPMVVKHNENCHRFGVRRVEGPLDGVTDDLVYQRVVDSADPGRLLDYRLPVVAGAFPYLYLYERIETAQSMKNDVVAARIRQPEDQISDEELLRLRGCCRDLGLDFGELDLQRDRSDGQLYLLDANKTPDAFMPRPDVWERPTDGIDSLARLSNCVADAVDAAGFGAPVERGAFAPVEGRPYGKGYRSRAHEPAQATSARA